MPSVRHHTNAIASSSVESSAPSARDGAYGGARRPRRILPIAVLALASLTLALVVAFAGLGAWSPRGASGAADAFAVPVARAAGAHIDLVSFERDIDPASARFLEDAITTAEGDGASLLVITLNTPGGDVNSMESIVSAELASKVPIAVYIGDAGAHAASAGMFVALAAPIVAMAPDTRIGAASPVDVYGGDLGSTLKAKVESDLLTLLNPIQSGYHRSLTDADNAVTQAAAFDNTQAVSDHMVDLQVSSRDNLISQLNDYSANFHDGTPFTLHTAGQTTEQLQPTIANQFETLLFDPTLLFILFVIAAICIYLELAHPGAIVPGTVGALALLLFIIGSFAIQPNWAGFVLMLLAIVLLAIDVRVPTHGVLTVGALISLVIGSLLFFDSGVNPGAQGVSPFIILSFALGVGVVAAIVLRFAIAAQLRRVTTGKEGYIGQIVTVIEPLNPAGRVRLLGENWQATLDARYTQPDIRLARHNGAPAVLPPTPPEAPATPTPVATAPGLAVGARARVVRVEGLTLIVEPA